VECPTDRVCSPVLKVCDRLDEDVAEQLAGPDGITDGDIDVTWLDVQPAKRQCDASVEPPVDGAAVDAVKDHLERLIPKDGPQPRTLQDHLLKVLREPRMDGFHVWRRVELTDERVPSERTPTHVDDPPLIQRNVCVNQEARTAPNDLKRRRQRRHGRSVRSLNTA
jgi:hypothetical protein